LWQTQRFERKFPVPEGRAGQALALLKSCVLSDPDYPYGVINSVYYDTLRLDAFSDALNGDYRKQKIRLRWYGEPAAGEQAEVFLEAKSKEGPIGKKVRVPRVVHGSELQDDAIAETLRHLGIASLLLDLGVHTPGWLRPIIQIRYQRYRFVDPLDGTPISLDLSIRSRLLERTLATAPGWLELRNAVIEMKGNKMDLPPMLRELRGLMPVWTSFSKYARCLEGHLEQPGSMGWLTAI
jgi:hypothetical protein